MLLGSNRASHSASPGLPRRSSRKSSASHRISQTINIGAFHPASRRHRLTCLAFVVSFRTQPLVGSDVAASHGHTTNTRQVKLFTSSNSGRRSYHPGAIAVLHWSAIRRPRRHMDGQSVPIRSSPSPSSHLAAFAHQLSDLCSLCPIARSCTPLLYIKASFAHHLLLCSFFDCLSRRHYGCCNLVTHANQAFTQLEPDLHTASTHSLTGFYIGDPDDGHEFPSVQAPSHLQ